MPSMAEAKALDLQSDQTARPCFAPELAPPSPPSPFSVGPRSAGLPPLHGARQSLRSKSSSSLIFSLLHRTRSSEHSPPQPDNASMSGHESPLSLHSLDGVKFRGVTEAGGRSPMAKNDNLYTEMRNSFISISNPGSLHREQSIGNLSTPSPKTRSQCSWDFLPYPTNADRYTLFECVGKGATAEVYLAYCADVNADVAIKMVKLDDRAIHLPSIIAEVSIMKQLHYRHLLPLYAAFVEEDQLWMVMPFVAGGSVLDIMNRQHQNGMNEHVIATILKPVAQALEYLHKDGLIHRDLKAGNILLDHEGKVILADMGVAAVMERNHDCTRHEGCPGDSVKSMTTYLCRKTFAGTPCWMAPEVMDDQAMYDCSADIWSFGITVLELALGEAPLAHCNLDQILMKTLHDEPPILESSDRRKRFTNDLKDLVEKCLQKDPNQRPSASALLKHPFWKAAYDGKYLAKQLDIGMGAALAGGGGSSVVRGAANIARNNVVKVLRNLTDKTLTGEEVDTRDSYKLMQRVTAVREWKDPEARSLPFAELRQAKGLAVAMLKSHGTGIKFLRGSGFVLGRCRDSRRETRWSAPLYFTISIRDLPRHLASMENVHMAIVIPTEEALAALAQPECSFEPPELLNHEDDVDEGHSSSRKPLKKLGNLLKKHVAQISLGRLSSPYSSNHQLSNNSKCPTDGINPSDHSKAHHEEGMPQWGYGVEVGNDFACPLPFRLSGAHVYLDANQNGLLYGRETLPEDILQITRTNRPAAFNRFVRDLEALVESGAPAPDDGTSWKTNYFQQ